MAQNLSDYELRQSPDQPPPLQSFKSKRLWIVAALLIVVAGLAYYLFNRSPTVSDTQTNAPKPAAADSTAAGRNPSAVTLPPIEQSDGLVRKLVSELSSNPTVAAWLATDDLVRNFTVVVSNIAAEESPGVHVNQMRPKARFQIIERNGQMTIDPRSYQRYTPIASAVGALDAEGCARLYATLKPLMEKAHRDLGYNTSFDATFESAIIKLLSTPTLKDPVRVVPHGIGYAFEDPKLEALSPAQKHLLRFGPANAQVVQQALRNIAVAAGIPRERLPK